MSWLDDLTPDAGDPTTGAIFGALAGLGKSAQPMYDPRGQGVTGGSPGNALLAIIGNMAGGIQGGMKGAQEYKAADMANQGAALGLEQAQAAQPAMMNMIKGMDSDPILNPTIPGSLAGGAKPMPAGASAADAQFATAFKLARMSRDPKQMSSVLVEWAKVNPQLAGEIENAKAQNQIVDVNGHKVMGSEIMGNPGGGSTFGSLAPQAAPPQAPPQGASPGGMQTQPPITPVQGPQGLPPIPQVNASALQPPPPAGAFNSRDGIRLSGNPDDGDVTPPPGAAIIQPSKAKSVDWNNPTAVKAASKEAEDNASNLAEAEKTYAVMQANFPNVMQRINDMSAANPKTSFGPANNARGAGPFTAYHDWRNDDTSKANSVLEQRGAQGVMAEIGPALSQAGLKGNKFVESLANQADNIDLSRGEVARQSQIDGLAKQYIQLMKSQHDQTLSLGGSPAPLPKEAVGLAVKYGIMTREEAKSYLVQNHGMQ